MNISLGYCCATANVGFVAAALDPAKARGFFFLWVFAQSISIVSLLHTNGGLNSNTCHEMSICSGWANIIADELEGKQLCALVQSSFFSLFPLLIIVADYVSTYLGCAEHGVHWLRHQQSVEPAFTSHGSVHHSITLLASRVRYNLQISA